MIEKTDYNPQLEKFIKSEFSNFIKNNDPYENFLIYKTCNQIIGFISYSIIYERAEINYIAVKMDYRKQKIGTELLKQALKEIENRKCTIISLEVEINNIPAINLYTKFGFIKKVVRKDYYNTADAYLMIKEMR